MPFAALAKCRNYMRQMRTNGTAAAGLHHAAKVTSQCNCIFQAVDQQNDIGVDAYIEFVVSEAAIGCCIAVQVKFGTSYCSSPKGWRIPSDSKHFAYWRSHSLPVCGIVYDPETDSARWVDISAFLAERADLIDERCDIPIPDENVFQAESFPIFRSSSTRNWTS
jgi:hypothetical protein